MNKKQQFNSFDEELQHDYHRYKTEMQKRQKIKFIAALPLIILMGIGIIILFAFMIFGIIGRFIFL